MGQKVNPVGLRLGVNRGWDSVWYAKKKDFGRFPSWEINGEIISGTRDLNELATKTDYQGDLNF